MYIYIYNVYIMYNVYIIYKFHNVYIIIIIISCWQQGYP